MSTGNKAGEQGVALATPSPSPPTSSPSPSPSAPSPSPASPSLAAADYSQNSYQNTWTCVRCTFAGNQPAAEACEICATVRPVVMYGGSPSAAWACSVCTFVQQGEHFRCEMCNSPRTDRPPPATGDVAIDVMGLEHPLMGLPNDLHDDLSMPLLGDPGISRPTLIRQGSDIISKAIPKMMRQISQHKEFFCGICLNNVDEREKASLCCPHEYCKGCMEEYVTLEIKEARVLNVTCPGMTDGKKCDAPFSAKDIKEIVKDKNILDKYERFLKLKTNDNFTECPYCNQMQKGTRRQPRVVCERKECGKTFCFIHSAAHPNETCAEYKRKNKERFAADRKYLDENSIYCPNMFCRTPIYKTSGCNHMTCSRCASEFCYLCGGLYMGGLHFHELNCLGCPNQQSSDGGPNSNKSWRRSLKSLFGWPLMLILCSCPLACLLGLFLCFEACWAALFALCLPCILVKNCRLMRRESRRSVDEFRTVACAGPVFCGLMWRACGCGMAGCRCCLQVKWLCPDI